jgi:membrane protein required for colicin V production
VSPLDLSLLALIGVSALLGLLRGFVAAVASVLAWVLGAWAAFRYGAQAALLLADASRPTPGELFGGYAICFVAALLLVGAVGWLVGRLVKGVGLSGLDRLLGLGLGLLRGAFVACAAVLLLGLTAVAREPAWRNSRVVPVLLPGAALLRNLLPRWVAERVDFGNAAPTGDNGRHREPLPLPLDEGVPQAEAQPPAAKPLASGQSAPD